MSTTDPVTPDTGANDTPPEKSTHDVDPRGHDLPRRGFLYQAAAALAGFLALIVPVGSMVVFALDPLLRKRVKAGGSEGDGAEFVPVTRIENLPADGTPMAFTIHEDRIDAWSMYPNQRVGSVWLRRDGDRVIAFNSVCPHLGCSVDYRAAEGDFFCPCHASAFALDGDRKNTIPPRGMDELETRVGEDGAVLVRFQNFQPGSPEKEVVG